MTLPIDDDGIVLGTDAGPLELEALGHLIGTHPNAKHARRGCRTLGECRRDHECVRNINIAARNSLYPNTKLFDIIIFLHKERSVRDEEIDFADACGFRGESFPEHFIEDGTYTITISASPVSITLTTDGDDIVYTWDGDRDWACIDENLGLERCMLGIKGGGTENPNVGFLEFMALYGRLSVSMNGSCYIGPGE